MISSHDVDFFILDEILDIFAILCFMLICLMNLKSISAQEFVSHIVTIFPFGLYEIKRLTIFPA